MKKEWINNLKFFACIFVVFGHTMMGLHEAEIFNNESIYNIMYTLIYSFHMPLFMAMSGYLYSKEKFNDCRDYFRFIRKKFINLAIPYFIFSTAHILLNIIFSSSVNNHLTMKNILNLFVAPTPPFWFLYVLFFIFLIVPLIEKLIKNRNIIFLFFILLNLIEAAFSSKIYIIEKLCEYLVFFYYGYILKKYEKNKFNFIKIFLIVIFELILCYNSVHSINSIVSNVIIIGIELFVPLLIIEWLKNLFSWLPKSNKKYSILEYSFPIYLMHTIFSAGIRIILLHLYIKNIIIHLVSGLFIGIIGPILVTIILKKTRYGMIVLYPLNTIRELKNENINS